MTEFKDAPGNIVQETLEYLSKIDQVVAGKLVVGVDEDSDDDQPRSRTSSTGSGSGEPKIYHGGPIQELRELFNKMDKEVSGKLIVGETQFNDDSDSDDEDYFKVHAD